MSITDARAGLEALTHLNVDAELPDKLAADGLDHVTVAETAAAVELALTGLDARARAQALQAHADAAAAAIDPDDASTATAAAAAQAEADAAAAETEGLIELAVLAARQALAGLNRRHSPMEAAVADAGGSHQVARPVWYDR